MQCDARRAKHECEGKKTIKKRKRRSDQLEGIKHERPRGSQFKHKQDRKNITCDRPHRHPPRTELFGLFHFEFGFTEPAHAAPRKAHAQEAFDFARFFVSEALDLRRREVGLRHDETVLRRVRQQVHAVLLLLRWSVECVCVCSKGAYVDMHAHTTKRCIRRYASACDRALQQAGVCTYRSREPLTLRTTHTHAHTHTLRHTAAHTHSACNIPYAHS